jgi:hypothetical protein
MIDFLFYSLNIRNYQIHIRSTAKDNVLLWFQQWFSSHLESNLISRDIINNPLDMCDYLQGLKGFHDSFILGHNSIESALTSTLRYGERLQNHHKDLACLCRERCSFAGKGLVSRHIN